MKHIGLPEIGRYLDRDTPGSATQWDYRSVARQSVVVEVDR
jgi:hypothetical protein